jgi:signal transduction histidine kinase/ABC-type uncharacterized transport system substrate-binding protein
MRWSVLFILLLGLLIPIQETAAREHDYILYVDSYHHGYPWSEGIIEGVTSRISGEGYVELAIEHLDAKHFPESEPQQRFLEILKVKYTGDHPPDAVIVSDDPAFDLIMNHRQELLPDIPIVFLGINQYSPERIAGRELVFGIADSPDIQKTLEAARTLHPESGTVAVVHDQTVTGMFDRERVIDFLEEHPGFQDFSVTFITNKSFSELDDAVRQLPDDALILALHFIVDKEGVNIEPDAYIEAVASKGHPVYIVNDLGLGSSPALGGYIRSSSQEGYMAADLALQAIKGPVAQPLITSSKRYIFNYQALDAHGIREADLPSGAELINRPEPLDERIKVTLIILALALILMALMVTLLILSRKQIKHQAGLLEKAFNEFPQPIAAVYHKKRAPIFINDAMANILSISKEDLASMETLDINRQLREVKGLTIPEGLDDRAVNQHQTVTEQVSSEGEDAKTYLILQKIPFTWQARQALITVIVDVSEQVLAQQRLRQSDKLEAVGQLTGGIAHDFNNQIMAILGYAEMLELKLSEKSLLEYVKYIIMAAESSRALTGKLLAFSRKQPFEKTRLDLYDCVETAKTLFSHTVDRRIRVHASLPDRRIFLNGDRAMIENALLNLCLNASDAIEGRGEVRIELSIADSIKDQQVLYSYIESPPPYACLSVSDTGSGIDTSTLRQMFDPFFTTKMEGHGTGMGLPSVLRTVRFHQGAIALVSSADRGTTFRLYVPFETSQKLGEIAQDSQSRQGVGSDSAGEGRGEKILVVDDEHLVRYIITGILQDQGFEVSAAGDGYSAIETFTKAEADFDLVILDMIMPGLNGFKTFRALRQIRPDVKVILVTGYSDIEQVAQMRSEGLAAYLEKPINRQKLIDTCRNVLDRG